MDTSISYILYNNVKIICVKKKRTIVNYFSIFSCKVYLYMFGLTSDNRVLFRKVGVVPELYL